MSKAAAAVQAARARRRRLDDPIATFAWRRESSTLVCSSRSIANANRLRYVKRGSLNTSIYALGSTTLQLNKPGNASLRGDRGGGATVTSVVVVIVVDVVAVVDDDDDVVGGGEVATILVANCGSDALYKAFAIIKTANELQGTQNNEYSRTWHR